MLVIGNKMKAENTVSVKSEDFALRIVKLYKYLTTRENDREFVMSKQLLRSGTSIGADIAEAEFAISKDDFKAKLYISLKECNESRYWIRLLHKSAFITDNEYKSLYKDSIAQTRYMLQVLY